AHRPRGGRAGPAAPPAPATLFGEWRVTIMAMEEAPSDQAQRQLAEALAKGGDVWPGTTLPDIGEITLQASRIAGDIGTITNRIGGGAESTGAAGVQAGPQGPPPTGRQLTPSANAHGPALHSPLRNP